MTRRRIHPARLAALLAAAVLTAIVCSGTRLAAAGPVAATKQTALHTSHTPAAPADTETAEQPIVPRGRAYLFRGALGPIFSRGMDRLTEQIQRAGIAAEVYEFTICGLVASRAVDDYRRDPEPVILIGHSMGGRCALQFSERLQEEGIPVSLVVTIDPAHLSPDVPLNVERFINIFLSKNILGGGDIKPTQGFQGNYASYDLDQHDEVSHITIDKVDAIHQQLVTKILQLSATPAKADGETVQLRYVVPPKQDIELWDSGMVVDAHSGDTLQALAAQYHLPLWSLTQVNQMPDDAPLAAGQRVIVPRYLTPPATASEHVLSKR